LTQLQDNKIDLDKSHLTKLKQDLVKNQCTILTDTVMLAERVSVACEWVLARASKHDHVIIFGSFYTVAEAMMFFSELNVNNERLS
jgi:folylpolyglutamate synthase/dihydropteroate synthase